MKNLLVGNGVNIQHGGYDFGNEAIILRTLKSFENPNFPKHIIASDPIEIKCYIGYLFLEIEKLLDGRYNTYTTSTVERQSLEEFKNKYKDKKSLKITDIGFEDYYLIHDLLCHKVKVGNPERYIIREALKGCFLNSIYDGGRVNTTHLNYSSAFIEWLTNYNQIFTTNYDNNIELATGKAVFHLHGDFFNRSAIYMKDSFRNQLSDCPYDKCVIDETYSHLYSTALTTYSGDYKQYSMDQGEMVNSAVEKLAIGYIENLIIKRDVDSWENDRNSLVARLQESILLKVNNPDLKFQEPYPIRPLREMIGELAILGLSPYNDRHLFKIINDSALTKCTYYYHSEKERSIISSLLTKFDVNFEDSRSLWEKGNYYKIKSKNINKRIKFKPTSRYSFKQIADLYRSLSASIMSDFDIINQFNGIDYSKRVKIYNRIKELEVQKDRIIDQQFVLNIIDLHIIAAEFNIDPAVVCFVGTDQCKNEFIRLK